MYICVYRERDKVIVCFALLPEVNVFIRGGLLLGGEIHDTRRRRSREAASNFGKESKKLHDNYTDPPRQNTRGRFLLHLGISPPRRSRSTVDFRNFIVFFGAETLAH